MSVRKILVLLVFVCAVLAGAARSGESGGMGAFLGDGVDFKGGMLDWGEDDQGNRIAILRNYAVVILPTLTVSARNMVLNVELQELYAEGDVVFEEADGNAFYCDQITFNYGDWQGLAKNIRLKMDNKNADLPVVDFLDVAPSTSVNGRISSMNSSTLDSGELRRMYVNATEMRAHGRDTFELIDAQITPDAFAKPHWYFRSPAALLRRKEKIESYHNTVNIGRVPVLYFPYLIRDLQYDWPWMRITAGHSGKLGYMVQTQWGWQLRQNDNRYLRADKILLDLDLFSRRGFGVGLETRYEAGFNESRGRLKLYGVYEILQTKTRDAKRANEDNQSRIYKDIPGWRPELYRRKFRWDVEWEHWQEINDKWDVRAEVNLFRDRDYLKEYNSARYWGDRELTNSIDIRRQDRHWEMEFVAESRLSNKWVNSSEYYPEMRLTVPAMTIMDTPFVFKDDFRLGVVNRRFDNDRLKYTKYTKPNFADPSSPNYAAGGPYALDSYNLPTSRLMDRDNYGTIFRAFNEMRLELPLKLADALTFKPWVGLRTAYYSKTLGEPLAGTGPFSWDGRYSARPQGMSNSDWLAYTNKVWTPGQMREARRKGKGEWNFAVPFGVDISTRLYTLFGANEQWRLITEPTLSYLEQPRARINYHERLYPIDEWDEYVQQRRLTMSLNTKLQRRYYEESEVESVPTRDILDFAIGMSYYPRREDRWRVYYDEKDKKSAERRRFSEIIADITYRPIPRLEISGSVNYDPHDNVFNRLILGADWRLSNLFRARIYHYFYSGNNWRYPLMSSSSETQFALRTKLWNENSHYSIEGALTYQWRNNPASLPWQEDWTNKWGYANREGVRRGFNRYRITLFRDMDTFEMSVTYSRNRFDNDHAFYFNLSPKEFMGHESTPPTYQVALDTLTDGRYPDSVQYLGTGYLIDTPVADADLKDMQF